MNKNMILQDEWYILVLGLRKHTIDVCMHYITKNGPRLKDSKNSPIALYIIYCICAFYISFSMISSKVYDQIHINKLIFLFL